MLAVFDCRVVGTPLRAFDCRVVGTPLRAFDCRVVGTPLRPISLHRTSSRAVSARKRS
jgi:hypothetical protein